MFNSLAPIFPDTLLLDGPGGVPLIFEGPVTETHRPSRIAAAIADPSSVTRTCNCPAGSRSQARGGPEESVVRLPRWLRATGLCPVPQEVVRTFDRSPFGGSRNTRSQAYRENGRISSRHFGWGDLGHGDSRSYQAPLSGTNAQLGHQRTTDAGRPGGE
jgi:hypothetical protein